MLDTKNKTRGSPRDLTELSSFEGLSPALSTSKVTKRFDVNVGDVMDQLLALKNREVKDYLCQRYLHAGNMYLEWRLEISEWIQGMKNVINSKISSEKMMVSNEVVAISLSYFDLYFATTSDNDFSKEVALLTALTSFYLALKVHHTSLQVDTRTLVELFCDGKFNSKDILDMEHNLLKAISYRMNPPTTMTFLSLLFELIPCDVSKVLKEQLAQQSRRFVEISAFFAQFVSHSNLSIAFAATLNAIEDISCDLGFDDIFKHGVPQLKELLRDLTEVEGTRELLRSAVEHFAKL